MMVARVWMRAGLKPDRMQRYMASDDPEFEKKAADIIGLHLDPPRHTAVFCLDEKSHTQVVDLSAFLVTIQGSEGVLKNYRAWPNDDRRSRSLRE